MVFKKVKIVATVGVLAAVAWWGYQISIGVYPAWWDGIGALFGLCVGYLLFRPDRDPSQPGVKRNAFVTIDLQGWYFHFHTRYNGWLYRPSSWVLRFLGRSKYINVVETFVPDDGGSVRRI